MSIASATNNSEDLFTGEVVKNSLQSLADEMALSVLRTAHSEVVRDTMDFSTAIFDRQARAVAQGVTLPLHLGAMPEMMSMLLQKYEGRIDAGDVFLLNDPDEGGMHLPDMFVVKPIFANDGLIAFAACVAHHLDVGGRVFGSNAVDSTEIYQEGIQVPLLKLYEAGEPCEPLFEILRKNVRPPDVFFGDLRAQLAACHTAEVGVLRLAKRYGIDVLATHMERLLNYSESVARAAIAHIPDGVYCFTDHIDDDGMGSDPIAIAVELRVAGEELTVDFEGTSPQVKSALNSTASFTRASVYTALLCSINDDAVISNDGFYRPITVKVPKGSILDGKRPAPRAARGLTGFRVIDAVFGALHQALPDTVPAAGEGGLSMLAMGETRDDGSPIVFVEFTAGSWGGNPCSDGHDGTSPFGGNVSNVPAEMLELRQPMRVEGYGLVADTGGPGRHRGGMSVYRDLRFLGEEGMLQVRSDRRLFPPYGLAGGRPGSPSLNLLNADTDQAEVLPSKVTRPIRRGDVLRHITAGGGGHGEPRQREPESVLRDFLDEKISRDHALEHYGVSIDAENSIARA